MLLGFYQISIQPTKRTKSMIVKARSEFQSYWNQTKFAEAHMWRQNLSLFGFQNFFEIAHALILAVQKVRLGLICLTQKYGLRKYFTSSVELVS